MSTIYDDSKFFSAYSSMTRSEKGLAGAGEWETLRPLIPEVKGKTVLDLGCGFGWHPKYFAENGAEYIRAVDASENMIRRAREINDDERIHYEIGDIEKIEYGEERYDLVFSSLVFHYVRIYRALIEKIHSSLKSNGILLFSFEHPSFTAEGSENWCYDERGEIRHFPLDNYFREGVRMTDFIGCKVEKYHRTLTTYISELLDSGFSIKAVKEPKVPEHLKNLEEMKNEWRRPMMLIIKAEKQS